MRLLTFILLIIGYVAHSQYPSVENFTSFDGVDEWSSHGGNTGSHAGYLCVNTSGVYSDDSTYIFESPDLDFSDCGLDINYEFYVLLDVRNNKDILYVENYDGAWNTLHAYTGSGAGTISGEISNLTTKFRFRFVTGSTGSTNNKYIHIDYIQFDCSNILPVSLIAFECETKQNSILLEWVTATEFDSEHFIVQRSHDGTNWFNIGNIYASGYSDMLKEYSFLDTHPIKGDNYYRLIEVSGSGTMEFLGVVNCIYDIDPEIFYIEIGTGRILDKPYKPGVYIRKTVTDYGVHYEKILHY